MIFRTKEVLRIDKKNTKILFYFLHLPKFLSEHVLEMNQGSIRTHVQFKGINRPDQIGLRVAQFDGP